MNPIKVLLTLMCIRATTSANADRRVRSDSIAVTANLEKASLHSNCSKIILNNVDVAVVQQGGVTSDVMLAVERLPKCCLEDLHVNFSDRVEVSITQPRPYLCVVEETGEDEQLDAQDLGLAQLQEAGSALLPLLCISISMAPVAAQAVPRWMYRLTNRRSTEVSPSRKDSCEPHETISTRWAFAPRPRKATKTSDFEGA